VVVLICFGLWLFRNKFSSVKLTSAKHSGGMKQLLVSVRNLSVSSQGTLQTRDLDRVSSCTGNSTPWWRHDAGNMEERLVCWTRERFRRWFETNRRRGVSAFSATLRCHTRSPQWQVSPTASSAILAPDLPRYQWRIQRSKVADSAHRAPVYNADCGMRKIAHV